ncbi:hypothetical protein TMPK1_36660 [Rhodospirillales bacterium TMPK1]|uniref:Uncharacterized protein n=2 Tax=Roseiterribacter gracilis TaxID=2812848 RepID=A0A8S8XHP1_9PROT|nr:hypothetical protein TMPK1_36660 [Rhodospirillales bacterium TMPK1]
MALFFVAAPAVALEPVIDFAQIARITQQLATSIKQLQVLTQSNGNLQQMLGAIGPLGEMAGLDATALGGLGSGGLNVGALLDKSFPDGFGLGTLASINLDDVGKWAIKEGIQNGLSTRAIAGKAFDLTLADLQTQPNATTDDIARIFARGGYAGLETVPGVVDAVKRGARGDMQDQVDRAFGASAQLQAAGIDLTDPAAATLRQAIEGGIDKQAIGRAAYQAILDGATSKGLNVATLSNDAVAGMLRDAGLKGLEKLPGLLDSVQQAGRTLGGLADLRDLAPPAQLFRASSTETASFADFTTARDATRAALWSGDAITDAIAAQNIAAARGRVQAEAIGTAYPLALRLRAELAKQPARIEALAEDAKAAATLNAQLRESNKATLALVQSASRMEAALGALLGLEAAEQLQAQPNGAPP